MVSITQQNGEGYYEDNFDECDCNMVILSYTYLGGQDASNDDSDDNDIMTMTDLGGRG